MSSDSAGDFRIKVRCAFICGEDGSPPDRAYFEVFEVNGVLLTDPIELGVWLSTNVGDMANLIVESMR